MPQTRLASLLIAFTLLTACGKDPAPTGSAPASQPVSSPAAPTPAPEPHPHPTPTPAPDPQPAPQPEEPDFGFFHHASLWAHPVSNSLSWTKTVIAIVRMRQHDFEKANDVETFCPGYAAASRAQKEICWLRLVGGVVEFESSFQPDEKPFYEGHGVYSVGLLALSTGECPNAPGTQDLMDPVKNLVCGVNKMAFLIARGHAIDDPEHNGADAYWSTLRPAHKQQLPDGRWVMIGKKDEIIARTKLFKQFR
jgi:hypothetical protein